MPGLTQSNCGTHNELIYTLFVTQFGVSRVAKWNSAILVRVECQRQTLPTPQTHWRPFTHTHSRVFRQSPCGNPVCWWLCLLTRHCWQCCHTDHSALGPHLTSLLSPFPAWICITKCFCARSKRGVLLAGQMRSTGRGLGGGWRRLLAIQARNCGSNPWPWSGPCLGSSPAPDNVKVWYFAWNASAESKFPLSALSLSPSSPMRKYEVYFLCWHLNYIQVVWRRRELQRKESWQWVGQLRAVDISLKMEKLSYDICVLMNEIVTLLKYF